MFVDCVPSEFRHGVRQTEDASSDHGGDIVEGGVPPLGVAGGCDGKPVVDRLLPLLLALQLTRNHLIYEPNPNLSSQQQQINSIYLILNKHNQKAEAIDLFIYIFLFYILDSIDPVSHHRLGYRIGVIT